MNNTALRDYLLGMSAEEEAESIEVRLLQDDDFALELRSVEDDLFDQFARNELDAGARAAFVSRYRDQKRRGAFARALTRRSNVVAFPQRRWMALAAAAAVAIVVASLWVTRVETPPPSSTKPPVARVQPPVIATAVMTLATARDGEEVSQLALPPDATVVRFRVRLDPADRFDQYRLFVNDVAHDLRAVEEGGDLTVSADFPASQIQPGRYRITVEGGATHEALGFAVVEVHR